MSKNHQFPSTTEGVIELVKALRAPDGCPWDRKQTLESLRQGLSDECAEVIEAIDMQDMDNLREEAGDLLMNLVFVSELTREAGWFGWPEICADVIEKMVRRHPHVFGDQQADDVDGVMKIWQKAKAAEKSTGANDISSIYDKNITTLSALDRATTVQKRAAKVKFDWPDQRGILDKIQEEVTELAAAMDANDENAIDEELGDLLFSAVNLARFRQRASADELLRNCCRKFIQRFQAMEKAIAADGAKLEDCSTETLENYYIQAKKSLKSPRNGNNA